MPPPDSTCEPVEYVSFQCPEGHGRCRHSVKGYGATPTKTVSVSRRTWALPPRALRLVMMFSDRWFQCPEGHGRCRHVGSPARPGRPGSVSVSRRTWALPPHVCFNCICTITEVVSVSRRTWALPPHLHDHRRRGTLKQFQCPEGHGRCRHHWRRTFNDRFCLVSVSRRTWALPPLWYSAGYIYPDHCFSVPKDMGVAATATRPLHCLGYF